MNMTGTQTLTIKQKHSNSYPYTDRTFIIIKEDKGKFVYLWTLQYQGHRRWKCAKIIQLLPSDQIQKFKRENKI